MKLLVTDGPRVKGLKVLFSGILIAFSGFLIAFATSAYGLAQFVMVVGWMVAVVGFVWHLAIMLGIRRKGADADRNDSGQG
jgi:hypothetical protein